MKYAIVGSRTFKSYTTLSTILDRLPDIELIISGGAVGADQLAEKYAKKKNIQTQIYYPDWELHGKAAGFIRNKDIIAAADKVVAFWDGISRGTLNSIDHARKTNKPVLIVRF